jgi:hypothetical protein
MKRKKNALLVTIIILTLFQTGCDYRDESKTNSSTMDDKDRVNINTVQNEATIAFFRYSSSYGGGDFVIYQIEADSAGYVIISYLNYVFIYYGNGASNEVSIPLSREKHDELVQIIKDYDLASWDGWGQDRDTSKVYLDAGGFELEIQWSNGASISAEDGDSCPENFLEADEAIYDFFKSFRQEWRRFNGLK